MCCWLRPQPIPGIFLISPAADLSHLPHLPLPNLPLSLSSPLSYSCSEQVLRTLTVPSAQPSAWRAVDRAGWDLSENKTVLLQELAAAAYSGQVALFPQANRTTLIPRYIRNNSVPRTVPHSSQQPTVVPLYRDAPGPVSLGRARGGVREVRKSGWRCVQGRYWREPVVSGEC